MVVCGQDFSPALLDRIQRTARGQPSLSRRCLSRRVCTWLNWRSRMGHLQDVSCRKALAKLNRLGLLDLPKSRKIHTFQRSTRLKKRPKIAPVSGHLAEMGMITVEPVSSRYAKASSIWSALMERYHYLGRGHLRGAQIRYLIQSSTHGLLGALAFNSGTWALLKRDEHIGWSEAAQRANLSQVVTNTRFLILPQVRVKNLASRVLRLTLERLPRDWETRYGIRPVLAETFVDPSRFKGTCYQAANWQYVGETSGRRDGRRKKIFVYPLTAQWRQSLCAEPPVVLGERARVSCPESWAQEEFGTVRWYDKRLKQRLYTLAEDFYHRPQANIPEAGRSKARAKAAYRFFQNKKVTMNVLLTPHIESTIERIKEHKVVLAPQDTSTLNYATHPMTEDLGPINNKDDAAVGLILHDTLAFTEGGVPLGILDAQCWARDPSDKGKAERCRQLPIEQKESMKWLRSFRKVAEIQKRCPGTMLVSIGDRESDIYELFEEALKDPQGPKLLVRADRDRSRRVDEERLLWEFMGRQKQAGSLKIHIPRRGSLPARDVWIDFRFAAVTLKAPNHLPEKRLHASELKLWAVYVTEQAPAGPEPLEWMLLTTVPVQNFKDAQKRVEWYAGRWGIEVFHRTLKSGCRIKDRQLGTADRLEKCLGIDMVVAWRIYHLTMLGRQTPDVPCTVFFKDVEWKALCCLVNQNPVPPKKPPLLADAIGMVAQIGGHLGRKSDGPPGTQTLWRGLQHFDNAAQMYAILTHQQFVHPLQSGP